MSVVVRTTSLALLTGLCACGYMILPPIGRRRRRRRQRRRRELQKTLIRRCIAWLSTEEHTECAGLGGMAGSKNRTGVDGARKSVFKHPPTWLYQPNANGNDMIAAHKLRTQYAKRRLRKNSMDKYKSDLYDPEDRLHGHDGLSSGDDEAESLSNQNYTTDLFSGLQVDSADDFFYARMVTGQPHTPAASLVHLVDANEDTYKCGVNANTNINVHVHVRGDENVNGNGNGNGNGEILGPSKTGVDSDADIDSVMLHLQSLVQAMEMKPKDNGITFDAPETSLHFETVGGDESPDSQAKAAEELAAMVSRLTA